MCTHAMYPTQAPVPGQWTAQVVAQMESRAVPELACGVGRGEERVLAEHAAAGSVTDLPEATQMELG